MDLKLKTKGALVTGSTAGIGFAIAKSLVEEGAHVYLNGRTQARSTLRRRRFGLIQVPARSRASSRILQVRRARKQSSRICPRSMCW
jgi:NAD(P)-dependent dehydrogenase (short-subunit alcohol dehydrogenase family)